MAEFLLDSKMRRLGLEVNLQLLRNGAVTAEAAEGLTARP